MKYFITTAASSAKAMQLPSGSVGFMELGLIENTYNLIYGLYNSIMGSNYSPTASLTASNIAYAVYGLSFSLVAGSPPYTQTQFTQGAILYQGELMYVYPSGVLMSSGGYGGPYYANISDYYDPTLDPIQFSDTTLHYCNRYRTITISPDAPTSTMYFKIGQPDDNFTSGILKWFTPVPNQISSFASTLPATTWTNFGTASSTFITGPTTPRYTKDGMGRVTLQGSMTVAVGLTAFSGATIVNLPSGYRPSQSLLYSAGVYNNSTSGYITGPVYVTSGGSVVWEGLTLSNYSQVDLSTITFLTL